MFKKALSMLCALVLSASCLCAAQAEYIGSVPDSGIYLQETKKHTCTLIACTMMLRNLSEREDGLYDHISESAVRKNAWNRKGLSWDFSVDGMRVECQSEIKAIHDKKAYLIEKLTDHPEGFVIYDSGAPHAVWLFGYDEEMDIFYCADTSTDVAGRTIRLDECILKGETQQDKIDRLDRIWIVSEEQETLL